MYNPYQMQQGFGQPQNFSATYSQMPQQLQQFTNTGYNAYFPTMPQMQAGGLGSIPQMQYQQQQPGSMFPSVTQSSHQPTMQSLQHQMGMSMQHAAASLPVSAAGLSSVNSVAANAHGMSGLSRLNDSSSGADEQHAIAAAALVAASRDLSGLGGGHHHHHHGGGHGGGHGVDTHGGNVRGGNERAAGGSSKADLAAERAARRPKKEKPKKPSGTETKQRTSVFSRPCKISPELQNVVGGDMLTRSEVVSRMWKYVRDNNLLDPKQKQFAVCDDKLERVIAIHNNGEKRFRVFGMMKYLKLHIFDPASAATAEKKAVAAAAAAAAAAGNGTINSSIDSQLHQLHNNGGIDLGPHNGGLVQFAPPIDQSSPPGGGGGVGGMHHSHSQHDLAGGNGASADLGSMGQVSVADDGSNQNELGDWNDDGGQQD